MSFLFRPWQLSDADTIVQHAANANIARFMSDDFSDRFLPENVPAFIKTALSHEPLRIFAIVVEGEAVGGIGLHPQTGISRKNAELGYWLGEQYWGQGIATAVIRQFLPYAFAHFDIERVFARPFGNNLASQRVLEKAGFTLEAVLKNTIYKNGEYLDEFIYGFRREDLGADLK